MPPADDSSKKTGPTYDTIRTQLLINNQQRTWDMIQHTSTVEIATLAGWFYLYSKNEFFISISLLIFSCVIVHNLRLSIIRYADLMSDASASLNSGVSIYLDSTLSNNGRLGAAAVSKRIPLITISLNIILVVFTSAVAIHEAAAYILSHCLNY